jgi:hypothetical protein
MPVPAFSMNAAVVCALLMSGCAAPRGATVVALNVEMDSLSHVAITDFTRRRLAGLIADRMSWSEPTPYVARIRFTHYDEFPALPTPIFGASNRLRIAAVVNLIDKQTGKTIGSQKIVRTLRLRDIDTELDLGRRGLSNDRYRGFYTYGMHRTLTRMRLLERAFASAVARYLVVATRSRASAAGE